ncbi:MAG: formylglycine-generating enzyme family protein [Treponema sp.]|nr:formylglycine-generating enzyme family protein [Treponema sp.]
MTRQKLATSADVVSIGVDSKYKLVAIPGSKYRMGATQVTQHLYKKVMGENPSSFGWGITGSRPVENLSWFDAVYFCNKLSMIEGLTPAYSVDGKTDPAFWGYTPHNGEGIASCVECNFSANGYRLPTNDEWEEAADGGESYTYSGSDKLDEVGWYRDNSKNETHPVAQKKPNGYGLYDMSGNVWEWVWDTHPSDPALRFGRGGSYCYYDETCRVADRGISAASKQDKRYGFRLLRPF